MSDQQTTMTEEELSAIILQDVHDAVDLVRGARVEDGPIVWLTGNSYMPPIRAWGHAETVWQFDDDGEAFERYTEEWERGVENHNIVVMCPDYDNALYAVDLTRWEYNEDGEDGESLADEWKRRGQ